MSKNGVIFSWMSAQLWSAVSRKQIKKIAGFHHHANNWAIQWGLWTPVAKTPNRAE